MESQWIEAEYVNFGRRIFVSGEIEGKEFCVELNERQREKLWDFNAKQERLKVRFLTELIKV